MTKIGELLARDLQQPIEEIVKVDQADEQSVYTEITEYIATERIQEQYKQLLSAIAEAPSDPNEQVGVWISGFFGSGKSSFAKNLGYVLANRTVLKHSASDLFKAQLNDPKISSLVDSINARIPTEVIMFDVTVDRAVRRTTEKIAEVMYSSLLRHLGYAEDYDIAELEIDLEREGTLDRFIQCSETLHKQEWKKTRKGAQKINRASATLHQLDPVTYPNGDSWAISLANKKTDITVRKFVERAFDLCARRRPGKALVFIIDEVGQYVARSGDKIEDLRAVTEEFGKVGKNLLKTKKISAPAWIIVTSQEKLDEVVAALDDQRIQLARLQDRFYHRVDMSPADIREVATRRVLAKKQEFESSLSQLFQKSQGILNAACGLERTHLKSEVTEADFVQFYPYLPHFIELSIEIMSGIRLQRGAPRHLGGSNRTIIKQAYEMLVSERTAMKDQPLGTLVTMDKIFELVEGNLSTEKRTDIDKINQQFKDDPDDQGMSVRVAKTICLLEFIRNLPRTKKNIAACLIDTVGDPAPIAKVEAALKRLYEAKFVRETEEGWKLQTAQEKNWETERRGFSPRPRDRGLLIRNLLGQIFGEPTLRTYRYKDLRTFQVGIKVDGNSVTKEGQIPLSIHTTSDAEEFSDRVTQIRSESRQESCQNEIYWVFPLNEDIDRLVVDLYASLEMVKKYDQMAGQNKISNEEATSLQEEKNEVSRLRHRLEEKLANALVTGTGLFRGVAKDGSDFGKNAGEVFKGLFGFAVPDLYPKLELGARNLRGKEAEEVLTAANLQGLSQIFYSGDKGLDLVIKNGANYVPNPEADIAKEVLDYLNQQQSYGERETRTGKALEKRFGGLVYGWELDMLRLILAVLFRSGSIEITSKGQRFDAYTDPNSRESFIGNTAFRKTLFTPVKPIGLKTLTQAVASYEELTGDSIDDVDKNAIASALKELATEELATLVQVEAKAKAHNLPVLEQLEEYKDTLTAIQNGRADDCVQILAGEGASLKDMRDRARQIRDALNETSLSTLNAAKRVIANQWSVVSQEQPELAEIANRLRENLDSVYCVERLDDIEAATKAIATAYAQRYTTLHSQRFEGYQQGINEIKSQPDWNNIPPQQQEVLLKELNRRACSHDLLADETWSLQGDNCPSCHASIKEMESDLAALSGLKSNILVRIQELTAQTEDKEVVIERVKLAEFAAGAIDSEEAVDQVVGQLKERLLDLVSKGVTVILE